MVTTETPLQRIEDLLAGVVDPEIPVLSIGDLGVLRNVSVAGDGSVTVTITPTYSGCPALGVIEEDIVSVLEAAGYERVAVDTVFSPAWTTDWMNDDARRRLNDYGIAPPGPEPVLCPQCSAPETTVVSPFGSTACKALMVCNECQEPFDHFKAI
ncbi:MAG: phenylacetate-CoA oxygenase subunit PaaJ [Acidimicrobiia bacterium]|nr:MAG: phenylacetate-CoA oxygenase subunit PaaJ [Acidimicrobiia bacterium]